MVLLEGFIELLSRLLIVYLTIALGIAWRFSRFFKKEYGERFTTITIWIFFPISIIASFAGIETFAGQIILTVAFIAFAVHIISYLAIYSVSRGRPPEEVGAKVLCSTFPNTLLFPFPIILAILGSSALFYASIFVFIAMALRNSFGVLLGIWYNPNNPDNNVGEEKVNFTEFKNLFFDLLKFPPFLALIVGLVLHSLVGAQAIGNIPGLEIIKSVSLYGALILVGISFQELDQLHPKNLLSKEILPVGFVRFLVAPIIAALLIILLQVPSVVAIVLMIQSMAPPAVSNIMYGKFFRLKEDEISLLITSLTLVALLLLPIELYVLLVLFPVP